MPITILLSNDDGYQAEGLQTLCRTLAKEKDTAVYVAAPLHQQSGTGHSMHTRQRVSVQEVSIPGAAGAWAIDGTPVDAVKIGLEKMLQKETVTCLISGINQGRNVGVDVFYSGTVGAAAEAAILGVPALAVSLDVCTDTPDYETAAAITVQLLQKILQQMKQKLFLLNVNIPEAAAENSPGIRTARLAVMRYHNELAEQYNEAGRLEFRLGGSCETLSDAPDDDVRLLDKGYVTLTPLTLERTDLAMLEMCQKCL